VEQVIEAIGPKIHQLRKQKNLSLQQLAERAGISAAAIHRIERNGMVPTIATLMKIAAALNRSVAYFVDEETDDSKQAILVRGDDRRRVYTSKSGLDLWGISGPYGRFFMAGALADVATKASSGPRPMEHPGEELVYVLAGKLSFDIDGDEFVLGPGDALHFRTDRPHRWWNTSRRPAQALWMALRST
jgi:transcriptional regulator with XRE-family HTH domain